MSTEIHPTAIISGNVKLGNHVKVHAFAQIVGDVEVGDHTVIGSHVDILGKVKIGQDCRVQSQCFIPSGVTLGDAVFVAPGVMFLNDKYPPSHGKSWMETVVEDGVTIGGGSTILPGVHIAKDVKVGAGSVVTKDLGLNGGVYFGNPARLRAEDGSEWGFYKDARK